jgi:hypothetical protein
MAGVEPLGLKICQSILQPGHQQTEQDCPTEDLETECALIYDNSISEFDVKLNMIYCLENVSNMNTNN